MALSTLPAESSLCAFCRCSLSELVLRPTFLLQIGHTFISGRLCCQSIDTLPCSLLSRARRALAKPSIGCARRCTFFSKFQAFARVKPLKSTSLSCQQQSSNKILVQPLSCNSVAKWQKLRLLLSKHQIGKYDCGTPTLPFKAMN